MSPKRQTVVFEGELLTELTQDSLWFEIFLLRYLYLYSIFYHFLFFLQRSQWGQCCSLFIAMFATDLNNCLFLGPKILIRRYIYIQFKCVNCGLKHPMEKISFHCVFFIYFCEITLKRDNFLSIFVNSIRRSIPLCIFKILWVTAET